MKKSVLYAVCSAFLLVSSSVLLAQESVLTSPTKAEMESLVDGMGLTMKQKLSLRSIFQGLREEGERVQGNTALSKDERAAQVVKLRQGALSQTKDILSAPQQAQLSALLLPKD